MSLWIDGARCPDEGRLERARRYGDGIFRTLLKYQDHLIDPDKHYETLCEDAGRLGLSPGPVEDWVAESQTAGEGQPGAVLRWSLVRAPGARGYTPDGPAAHRLIEIAPLPRRKPALWQRGISVHLSDVRLAIQPLLAGIKHLNRLEQVLASRAWPPDSDEALMCSQEGHLVCGTRSNLFWRIRGVWQTPALDRCGVNGQLRRKLLQMAKTHAEPVETVRAEPDVLAGADEVFVCNSLIGIWPVRAWGDCRWPAPGPQTALWMDRLAHPWQGTA